MPQPSLDLPRLGLALARFCVAAWVGAAVLFVVVGVREVVAPDFSSEIKDRLVTLRFPAYYLCGAGLLGTAVAGMSLARSRIASRMLTAALVLTLLALALMAADYQGIYSPLAAMITPPGQARTAAFVTLHHWSMRINTVHLALCLLAAGGLLAVEAERSAGSSKSWDEGSDR